MSSLGNLLWEADGKKLLAQVGGSVDKVVLGVRLGKVSITLALPQSAAANIDSSILSPVHSESFYQALYEIPGPVSKHRGVSMNKTDKTLAFMELTFPQIRITVKYV